MTKLQNDLVRAGRTAGLKVIVPYELRLHSCEPIAVDAYMPEVGSAKGMLIVRSYEQIENIADLLVKSGYGYSVLDEPRPDEMFDLDSYLDMFTDWGWKRTPESHA